MRHIMIRSILAMVWAAGAAMNGVRGNLQMSLFYLLLCGLCLVSAYSEWKKQKQ